jgi:lipoprotein-releasing system permease protein
MIPTVLLPISLAARLLQRRGTALLRTSALAALAAVALGVASLVIVLALMNGYSDALRSGILAGGGHLVAMYPAGLAPEGAAAAKARLLAVPGVEAVGEVLYLPALLFTRADGGTGEVVTLKATGLAGTFTPAGPPAATGPLPVAVGSGLARRLEVAPGDSLSVQVMTPAQVPRVVLGTVASVFHSGLAELDDRWVTVRLADLATRVAAVRANGLEVALDDPGAATARRDAVERAAGRTALVTTWQETNRNLFAALRWQKLSLGVLLSLVVGVGAFEVASALVVLVTEKRRQLGILIALGGEPRLLRAVILAAAGALGIAGVVTGIVTGVGAAALLTALGVPSFPPDIASIYMVDRIRFIVDWRDVALVMGLGVVEVIVAALLPARRVARWQPAEVLRWV